MTRRLISLVVLNFLCGCAEIAFQPATETPAPMLPQACPGTTVLPFTLRDSFETIEDQALLAKAKGKENEGSLCQAQVYQSKEGTSVVLYRAWNSIKPYSKLGSWWTFSKPEGKIADYRKDYEICYQWTPLDMLVQCTLKPGKKVVVGTGQSVECPEKQIYPVSATQQIYIDNAESALNDCVTFTGVFSWR
ncbi:hypothetical protein [Methylomonas sp. MgM2]